MICCITCVSLLTAVCNTPLQKGKQVTSPDKLTDLYVKSLPGLGWRFHIISFFLIVYNSPEWFLHGAVLSQSLKKTPHVWLPHTTILWPVISVKLNICKKITELEISQTAVNRNKQRILKHTSYGSFVKKHYQAIGDQYRKETEK